MKTSIKKEIIYQNSNTSYSAEDNKGLSGGPLYLNDDKNIPTKIIGIQCAYYPKFKKNKEGKHIDESIWGGIIFDQDMINEIYLMLNIISDIEELTPSKIRNLSNEKAETNCELV